MGWFSFKKGWWKTAIKRVVQVVATAISPPIGIVISIALETLFSDQQKSFSNENPIVEKTVTKWIDMVFQPYMAKLSQNLNIGETVGELTNTSRVQRLNKALQELATLKVYLDLEVSKSFGDAQLINKHKSDTVDFFIQNISDGYVKAVEAAVEKEQGNDVTINFATKRVEFEASKVMTLGSIIPLRWYNQTVLAKYTAFTTDFTSDPVDIIITKPIDDPIDVPPPPPPIEDDIIITDGSGSGSGDNTDTSGSDLPVIDNGTVNPTVKGFEIPWKSIAIGAVSYVVVKTLSKK
ncbi:hypothetical protein [uncultured Aquimarina sp.]|uniref:hypothetical protein n=1 Tax=uncultured Aquimarina sp. TaxID=575652 RepID=UPI002610F1F7|nr:hypothetical protein [uncultured Aquimarina sp.]